MEASVNEETPETMAIGEMPTGENVPHERCPRQPLATERLDAETVGEAVYDAIRQCAVTLRPDFRKAVEAAREEAAPESREAGVLDRILENARIGATDGVPICQDTGSVWVCLEVGESLAVPGNIFSRVNDAVARAYTDGRLRMSLVRDALFDRANTGDNTPAFCELKLVPGDSATLHVLLKGGGSDNASRVVMLSNLVSHAQVSAPRHSPPLAPQATNFTSHLRPQAPLPTLAPRSPTFAPPASPLASPSRVLLSRSWREQNKL